MYVPHAPLSSPEILTLPFLTNIRHLVTLRDVRVQLANEIPLERHTHVSQEICDGEQGPVGLDTWWDDPENKQ